MRLQVSYSNALYYKRENRPMIVCGVDSVITINAIIIIIIIVNFQVFSFAFHFSGVSVTKMLISDVIAYSYIYIFQRNIQKDGLDREMWVLLPRLHVIAWFSWKEELCVDWFAAFRALTSTVRRMDIHLLNQRSPFVANVCLFTHPSCLTSCLIA